jgi:transcriptional regulator with XRE-family HTH domain
MAIQVNKVQLQETIGGNLKRLIEEKSLSQENVTADTGIQNVSKHVNAHSIPDIETLIKYAKYFNVSLDSLCGIDIIREDDICKTLINYLKPLNEDDTYVVSHGLLTLSIGEPLIDYFKAVVREHQHKKSSKIEDTAFSSTLDKEKCELIKAIKDGTANSNDSPYVLLPLERAGSDLWL